MLFVYLLVCSVTLCVIDGVPPKKKQVEDIVFPAEFDERNSKDLGHSHKFVHNEEFHRTHGIPWPPSTAKPNPVVNDRASSNENDKNFDNSTQIMEIPISLAEELNGYSVNDLLLKFGEGEQENEQVGFQNRFGDDEIREKSAATHPKQAACMPELQTVRIAPDQDSNVRYFPECTRIERCGGCCNHNLLSCQPQQAETLSFKVYRLDYLGGMKVKPVPEIVQIEKHTKCACGCKIKAEDCKAGQEYSKNDCKCVCVNSDEEKKCRKLYTRKLWDGESCTCQCRESMDCSTGSYFDVNECKCMPRKFRLRDQYDEDY